MHRSKTRPPILLSNLYLKYQNNTLDKELKLKIPVMSIWDGYFFPNYINLRRNKELPLNTSSNVIKTLEELQLKLC